MTPNTQKIFHLLHAGLYLKCFRHINSITPHENLKIRDHCFLSHTSNETESYGDEVINVRFESGQ